jgi:hypothetical protein
VVEVLLNPLSEARPLEQCICHFGINRITRSFYGCA